jgi:hypothetical protein
MVREHTLKMSSTELVELRVALSTAIDSFKDDPQPPAGLITRWNDMLDVMRNVEKERGSS